MSTSDEKATPEKLRASAKRIREGAQYADRNEVRERELSLAREIESRADELEAQQAAQAE